MQVAESKENTLWCLPYDTDSVFKPFLKIPFSGYLNHLISNQHFPQYQAAVGRQLRDRTAWNDKCWVLIQYFEFLNEAFDIGVWDAHIYFREDNHLRSIMGYFRLWIDTERLYLLNFLKLDSNEFQDDRIFMALFRTLVFLDNLFNKYLPTEFDPGFLKTFISRSLHELRVLADLTTNETADIIAAILALLNNLSRRDKILIELNTLQSIRKSASIKVTKEAQLIRDVENRLQNSTLFKRKIDEEARLKKITQTTAIEEFSAEVRQFYDPIYKIEKNFDIEFYGPAEEKQRRWQEGLAEEIKQYKSEVKGDSQPQELSVYQTIEKSGNNPYSLKNYQMFGEVVGVDMDDKAKYEKEKQAEVASLEESDRSRFFYEENYTRQVEQAQNKLGRVTEADVSRRRGHRKGDEFKNQDENTRVFNLRWHQDPTSSRQPSSRDHSSKDYDNNLLFKSPLEEQLLDHRRTRLDRLKEAHGCNSYTMALLQEAGEELLGDQSSRGGALFVSRAGLTLDSRRFKLLNQNKFDFMRKVVGFMAGQKKIEKVIGLKTVPELYPRNFSDCRQMPYDPLLREEKIKLATGGSGSRPRLYL